MAQLLGVVDVLVSGQPPLVGAPARTAAAYVRAILFTRNEVFF